MRIDPSRLQNMNSCCDSRRPSHNKQFQQAKKHRRERAAAPSICRIGSLQGAGSQRIKPLCPGGAQWRKKSQFDSSVKTSYKRIEEN